MNYLDLYSREKNPETGSWYEYERSAMEAAHNGSADLDTLLATEYGRLMTESLELKVRFGGEDGCAESIKYLAALGV